MTTETETEAWSIWRNYDSREVVVKKEGRAAIHLTPEQAVERADVLEQLAEDLSLPMNDDARRFIEMLRRYGAELARLGSDSETSQ